MKGNPSTLKQALYNTIHGNHKGVEAIAEELGMTPSYLARAALPDEDMLGKDSGATGVRFPLKQLVPLIRATNDYQTLDYIENSLGRFAIKIPQTSASLGTVQREAIRAAAEFGELMKQISVSIDDGQLSRQERELIHKEGWEAITAIFHIIVGCEEGSFR